MRLITSVAAGVLAVVAVWVVTGRAPEAQGIEPVPETVVYSSIRPPNWDLYLFEQPGSPPRLSSRCTVDCEGFAGRPSCRRRNSTSKTTKSWRTSWWDASMRS